MDIEGCSVPKKYMLSLRIQICSQAVSLEQHVMQLTWKNAEPCRSRQHVQAPTHADCHALELAHLSKRVFVLIACTVLTVAGAVACEEDKYCMHLLSPLLECLKQLKLPPVEGGVSSLLNKAVWTIREMRDAVTKSAKELYICMLVHMNSLSSPLQIFMDKPLLPVLQFEAFKPSLQFKMFTVCFQLLDT